MSSRISGVAKINLRDEVDACVMGLRDVSDLRVGASAQQLQHSLAEVVGANLQPFVGRLGGELVASCKRINVPAVWEAAASLALATGGASSKPVCEPLIDLLIQTPTLRSETSLAAAATFLAVSGRFMPAALRSGLDYVVVKHLYDALVFSTEPVDLVHEHLQVLSASLATPSLLCANPVRPHALLVAERASHHPRLHPETRTAALMLLNFLDSQMHTQSAPIAVPTLSEIHTHLKRLEGVEATSELTFFDGSQAKGLFDASDVQDTHTTSATPVQSQVIFARQPLMEQQTPTQSSDIEPKPAQGLVDLEGSHLTVETEETDEPARKRQRVSSLQAAPMVPSVPAVASVAPVSSSLLQPMQFSAAALSAAAVPNQTAATPPSATPVPSAQEVHEEPSVIEVHNSDSDDDNSSISASIDLPDIDL